MPYHISLCLGSSPRTECTSHMSQSFKLCVCDSHHGQNAYYKYATVTQTVLEILNMTTMYLVHLKHVTVIQTMCLSSHHEQNTYISNMSQSCKPCVWDSHHGQNTSPTCHDHTTIVRFPTSTECVSPTCHSDTSDVFEILSMNRMHISNMSWSYPLLWASPHQQNVCLQHSTVVPTL